VSARPVHYHASGSGTLAFECYYRELQTHLAAFKAFDSTKGTDYPTTAAWIAARKAAQKAAPPSPARHTDLRRVTCPACWREIAHLARARGPKTVADVTTVCDTPRGQSPAPAGERGGA
jgi:hypothetical protein